MSKAKVLPPGTLPPSVPVDQLPPVVQQDLDAMRAFRATNQAEAGTPVDQFALKEVLKPEHHVIRLRDGRIVEFGPPSKPHILVLADMFRDTKARGWQLAAHTQSATMFQYIRRIDDQRLPGFIATWEEVETLMAELGDLSVRALGNAYAKFYPDIDLTEFEEIKN